MLMLLSFIHFLLFLLYPLNTTGNFLFVPISSYTISTIASFLLFDIWSAESWNTPLILYFDFIFLPLDIISALGDIS